jgi:lipopolysaccharide biosynthesis protein
MHASCNGWSLPNELSSQTNLSLQCSKLVTHPDHVHPGINIQINLERFMIYVGRGIDINATTAEVAQEKTDSLINLELIVLELIVARIEHYSLVHAWGRAYCTAEEFLLTYIMEGKTLLCLL